MKDNGYETATANDIQNQVSLKKSLTLWKRIPGFKADKADTAMRISFLDTCKASSSLNSDTDSDFSN